MEDIHIVPLAPASRYNPRSDEEFANPVRNSNKFPPRRKEKRSNKCLVYLLSLLVILSATLLVFSLIVRPSAPKVQLASAAVKSLRYGGDNSSTPWFNVTLSGEITIKNSNYGRFKFDNSTASVLYGGVVVGEVKLKEGSIKAKGTDKRDIVLDVKSNGLLDAENLRSDILKNGTLEMIGYANLNGKVHLFKYLNFRKNPVMNCTMSLNLTSSSIQDLLCS